jgi:hypothetical protein
MRIIVNHLMRNPVKYGLSAVLTLCVFYKSAVVLFPDTCLRGSGERTPALPQKPPPVSSFGGLPSR